MERLFLAFRKLHLQVLQTRYVSKGRNLERTKEQREVFGYLLAHPKLLFSVERVPKDKRLSKQLNVLTANAKNDKLYDLTKRSLTNV